MRECMVYGAGKFFDEHIHELENEYTVQKVVDRKCDEIGNRGGIRLTRSIR